DLHGRLPSRRNWLPAGQHRRAPARGRDRLPFARDGRQRRAEHRPGDSPAVGGSECQAPVDHGGVLRREPSELSGADSRPAAAGARDRLDARIDHRRCVRRRLRLRQRLSDRLVFSEDQRQGRPVRAVRRAELRAHRPAQGQARGALPAAAKELVALGMTALPTTSSSDSVNSFEVGAKNNIANRVKIASSIYYIRWNNIQQTVVPPTCQISFIDNLGQAVAKGADVQAEIALTERFTGELAAGYRSEEHTSELQ